MYAFAVLGEVVFIGHICQRYVVVTLPFVHFPPTLYVLDNCPIGGIRLSIAVWADTVRPGPMMIFPVAIDDDKDQKENEKESSQGTEYDDNVWDTYMDTKERDK